MERLRDDFEALWSRADAEIHYEILDILKSYSQQWEPGLPRLLARVVETHLLQVLEHMRNFRPSRQEWRELETGILRRLHGKADAIWCDVQKTIAAQLTRSHSDLLKLQMDRVAPLIKAFVAGQVNAIEFGQYKATAGLIQVFFGAAAGAGFTMFLSHVFS